MESFHSLPSPIPLTTQTWSLAPLQNGFPSRTQRFRHFSRYAGASGGFRFADCCSPSAQSSVRLFPDLRLWSFSAFKSSEWLSSRDHLQLCNFALGRAPSYLLDYERIALVSTINYILNNHQCLLSDELSSHPICAHPSARTIALNRR